MPSMGVGEKAIGIAAGIGLAALIFVAAAGLPGFAMTPALAADAGSASGVAFSDQAVRVRGNRISIDVVNAPIAEVLAKIAQRAGMDIVPGDGVTGEITLRLTDATLEEALEHLCRSRALVYEYLPDLDAYRIVRALAAAETGEKGTAASAASAGGVPVPGGSATGPEGTVPRQTAAVASTVPEEGQTGEPGVRDPSGGVGDPSEVDSQGRPLYMKGELLVKIRAGVTTDQSYDLHRLLGSTILGFIPKQRLQRIRLRQGLVEQEAIALYDEASGIVEYAERHGVSYPDRTANDPYVNLQWGLTRIQTGEAWDITPGKVEVVVAVIDTGVDYNHPDLKDNIWINAEELIGTAGVDDNPCYPGMYHCYIDDFRGWDFAGNLATTEEDTVPDNDPMDKDGHGTHVSGIIAAIGNNNMGISGINWRARIMPLKVQADKGNIFPNFAIIDAIQYVIDHGVKIVNCSFGSNSYYQAMKDAFAALKDAGGLAVCAAGNKTETDTNRDNDLVTHYPSGYNLDNIIAVAASGSSDQLASFSHYGATSVDLMAPGVDTYSTILQGTGRDARVIVGGTHAVEYAALGMLYAGSTDQNGITGTVYDCGQGYSDQFPAGVSGYIALIKRGNRPGGDSFYFYEKVRNAQTAGARGVVIYNNVLDIDDGIGISGGTLISSGNWVPVVSVTNAAGEALKAWIGRETTTLTLISAPADYDYMSGTSMAAPHVTGVAVLLKAQCPNLTYQEIRSAILNTVDPIGSVGPGSGTRVATGGRLNAYAALKSLLKPADLNGDCRIDVADAIIALRILGGFSVSDVFPCEACGGDKTGDNRIGLGEVFFTLQTAAGLR